MNRLHHRWIGALGLCVILSACGGHSQVKKNDEELGLNPQDSPAELYVKMAEEYYTRGQTEVAFRRAQQAIEADSKYPRAQVWLGFLYEEIGQAERAREHYQRAAELAPKNSDIQYAVGAFQCRQKRYAEAEAQFKKALANPLYATPWVAMTNAGSCSAAAGNAAQAERYYRDAMTANPRFGPALTKMAELAFRRGDAKTAKGYIDRYFDQGTIRTPSTSYQALTIGAQVERALGNRKRADYYENALKQNFPVAPKTKDL